MSINIIPEVRERNVFEGTYTFNDRYSFDCAYSRADKYIRTFLNICDFGEKITCTIDLSMKREEYTLCIDDSITITARDEAGIFRALATLKQIAVHGTVERQTIHDFPALANRGIMLDISRGRTPKLDILKRIINLMRDVKLNHLQLYMDGLVFEYAHFMKHIEGRDVITIKEILDIKAYCEDNFIDFTPNQNGFGHMEKWLELNELSELGIQRDDGKKTDTLNPLDKRSFEFVDTMYSDLIPYFNSEFINIGMDEPSALGMGQTKDACERQGKHAVYIEYLNKIIELCNKKYGKTAMFFDDIVFQHPESVKDIKGDCVVMDWEYEGETSFVARCEYLSRMGMRFYTCPGTSTWSSYTGRFNNMIANIENAIKAAIYYNGEGVLLTDWGDGGHPQSIAMSFIPYTFAACCAWNYPSGLYSFSYAKKVDIILHIEEFLNKFVFDGQAVAGLLHSMANYCLLEKQPRFNETYIKSDTMAYIADKPITSGWLRPILTVRECDNIDRYMSELRDELDALPAGTPYIDDIRVNCDIVILFSRFIRENVIYGRDKLNNTELKNAFIALRQSFATQWEYMSKSTGKEIFCATLDKIISRFN